MTGFVENASVGELVGRSLGTRIAPGVSLLEQQSVFVDPGVKYGGLVPLLVENGLHQLADLGVIAFMNHEDRRARAADRAAQQPLRSKGQNRFEAGDQLRAVTLMQLIHQRGGENVPASRRKRGNQ